MFGVQPASMTNHKQCDIAYARPISMHELEIDRCHCDSVFRVLSLPWWFGFQSTADDLSPISPAHLSTISDLSTISPCVACAGRPISMHELLQDQRPLPCHLWFRRSLHNLSWRRSLCVSRWIYGKLRWHSSTALHGNLRHQAAHGSLCYQVLVACCARARGSGDDKRHNLLSPFIASESPVLSRGINPYNKSVYRIYGFIIRIYSTTRLDPILALLVVASMCVLNPIVVIYNFFESSELAGVGRHRSPRNCIELLHRPWW